MQTVKTNYFFMTITDIFWCPIVYTALVSNTLSTVMPAVSVTDHLQFSLALTAYSSLKLVKNFHLKYFSIERWSFFPQMKSSLSFNFFQLFN